MEKKKGENMFYLILDIVTVGALIGIIANVIFDKYWGKIKLSAFLGIIGAIVSSLILEMSGFATDVITLGACTAVFLFCISIIGKIKLPVKHAKSFKSTNTVKIEK